MRSPTLNLLIKSRVGTETDVVVLFEGEKVILNSLDGKTMDEILPCEMTPQSTPKGASFPFFATLSLKQTKENMVGANVSWKVEMKIVSLVF